MALADKQLGDARSVYSPSALGGATESFSGWEPKKLWHSPAESGASSEECAWAEGFDTRTDGRSLVASDLDGDGDVDLLLLNRNSPRLQFFRNDGPVGKAVTLRFDPSSGTRDASNVTVRIDGRAEEVLLARGFASSVPPELTRGLGTRDAANVEVTWRSGKTQKFSARAGFITTLHEATGKATDVPFSKPVALAPLRFPSTLKELGLEAVGGKPTLVTLFLAGCEPCRKEAPALNAIAKKGEKNVLGLGITNTAEEARKVADALGFKGFEVKPVPGWAADALSTNGKLDFPLTLEFDGEGKLTRVLTTL
ncbi:MAG: ASPIC/UnbV domain-containing protein [Archangium sp.]|nr:ASPIC/UnbV domain-containing protein [Archangium sp.]